MHFDDTDDRTNTTAVLGAIPQNQFQNCFAELTRRCHRCVASQGEYSEGDHGDIQQWGMQNLHRDEFANFTVRSRTSDTNLVRLSGCIQLNASRTEANDYYAK
jgi:hypothetical protein